MAIHCVFFRGLGAVLFAVQVSSRFQIVPKVRGVPAHRFKVQKLVPCSGSAVKAGASTVELSVQILVLIVIHQAASVRWAHTG